MTRFKKNMRRFVVAAVVGAMAMSMTACTSHMFDEKTITGTIKDNADDYTKVQKEFEEYLHDEYVDSVTSDTLSYNYEIKNGDALGIPEPEVSLGDSDMSDEGIKKRKLSLMSPLTSSSHLTGTISRRASSSHTIYLISIWRRSQRVI